MKRMVHWDDEENGESEMEPFEEASETDDSDDEQSNDDEPRIKDVLRNLSKTVSRKHASDLLHSMAASVQRYLVLDTSRTVTPKPTNNTSDEHLRAGRVCVTTP